MLAVLLRSPLQMDSLGLLLTLILGGPLTATRYQNLLGKPLAAMHYADLLKLEEFPQKLRLDLLGHLPVQTGQNSSSCYANLPDLQWRLMLDP